MLGRYNDTLGFSSSNPEVDARSFVAEDGERMAVVVANQQTGKPRVISTKVEVSGYRFVEAMMTGSAKVSGTKATLGQFDLAVMLFEKQK